MIFRTEGGVVERMIEEGVSSRLRLHRLGDAKVIALSMSAGNGNRISVESDENVTVVEVGVMADMVTETLGKTASQASQLMDVTMEIIYSVFLQLLQHSQPTAENSKSFWFRKG